MKNNIKKTAAAIAAAALMAVCPLSVSAASLKTENGIRYIQYENGETKAYTGWTSKAGKRYYYKNGIMKKNCWLRYGGKRRYYLGKDGAAATGKITVSGIEYEFDEKGRLVEDEFGISINVSNVTPTGVTYELSIERPSDDLTDSLITADGEYKAVFWGVEYAVEKYTSEGWIALPYISDVVGWEDEAWELNGSSSYSMKADWKKIYGSLEKGSYRLCKKIYYYGDHGEFENKIYYGYFKV